MRIARHPGADALQKTVVPDLPARHGLVIGVPRRFREAGQQRLNERIDEREEGLLAESNGAGLANQTVEAGCKSILRRIDSALAPGDSRSIAARMKALGFESRPLGLHARHAC